MPMVDLVDDTFVVVSPDDVAAVVADPARWRAWWPDLALRTTRDRGAKGRQWAVSGALVGSAEIWLEPWADGVLVHYYLRADPAGPAPVAGAAGRWATRERAARAQHWKRQVHALKDELEAGRVPGSPGPAPAGALKPAEAAADLSPTCAPDR